MSTRRRLLRKRSVTRRSHEDGARLPARAVFSFYDRYMIDNPRSPRVRAVAKLAKRRARTETGLFLVEGPQALREALAFHPELLVDVYTAGDVLDRYPELARGLAGGGVPTHEVTDAVLQAMADTVTPQGVIAVCRQAPVTIDELLARGARLVAVLHEVRDPGNAGTIIRAADAAGADGVILTGNSVDAYNPKVVRSTTGSIFHTPIAQDVELDAALSRVRGAGLQVLAADISGVELPSLGSRLSAPPRGCSATRPTGSPRTSFRLPIRPCGCPSTATQSR